MSQRRVRFADESTTSASVDGLPPPASHDRLPSILDVLLAEHALNEQLSPHQGKPGWAAGTERSFSSTTPPPLQPFTVAPAQPSADSGVEIAEAISVHLSLDEDPAVSGPARDTTPPSPVLSVREEDHSALFDRVEASIRSSAPHAEERVQSSVTRSLTALSASPPALAASVSVSPIASLISPAAAQVGDVSVLRAQAAENVQRLQRSSVMQVNKLLSLQSVLEASETVRRDLEDQLRAAREEATEARLALLLEQNTQHEAVRTLSQENLRMQATIHQQRRQLTQREDQLRSAQESAAREHDVQEASLAAAQKRADELTKALEDARRTAKATMQLEREAAQWKKTCATTAEELAQARSANARLEAKVFELQRRLETGRLDTGITAGPVVGVVAAPTAHADGDDGTVVRTWDAEHVQFLRREIARVETLQHQSEEEVRVTQACLTQCRQALAEAEGRAEALQQQAYDWESRCTDEHARCEVLQQRMDVLTQHVQDAEAARDQTRAEWYADVEAFAASLFHTLADAAAVSSLEAVSTAAEALRTAMDEPPHVHRGCGALLPPLASAVEALSRAERQAAQALEETKEAHQQAVQRAESIQLDHVRVLRLLQAAQDATSTAAEAQKMREHDRHVRDRIASKCETLVANALREYDNEAHKEATVRLRGPRGSGSTQPGQGGLSVTTGPHAHRRSVRGSPSAVEDLQRASPSTTPPPSTVGAPTITDDGEEEKDEASVGSGGAGRGSVSHEAQVAPSVSADGPSWHDHHYQQLLRLLAGFRRAIGAQKARLDASRAKVTSLTTQLDTAQRALDESTQRLHASQAASRGAVERQAAQLTAAVEKLEHREAAFNTDLAASQRELATARHAAEALRQRVQTLERHAVETEAALEKTRLAAGTHAAEVENLAELLEKAKQELLVQKAALSEQAAKQGALKTTVAHHAHNAARVYQLLVAWVRFSVLLLGRLDRLGAAQAVWRHLVWQGCARETLAGPTARDRALSSAVARLLEVVRSAPLVSAVSGVDASSSPPSWRAVVSGTPPESAGAHADALRPARPRRLRAVVLTVLAVRRLAWLSGWHRALASEVDNTLLDAYRRPDHVRAVSDVKKQGGAVAVPRVVFFEEDVQAGRRLRASPSRVPAEDTHTVDQQARSDPLLTLLSPRVVRHSVLGLRSTVLPAVEVPALPELLAALERFHVEPRDVPGEGGARLNQSHTDDAAPPHTSVPAHTLVEYLLHRLRLCSELPVNQYCGWAYGLAAGGGVDAYVRLPDAFHADREAAHMTEAAAEEVASLDAVAAHVRTCLRTAAETQHKLLSRVEAQSQELAQLGEQNRALGLALESRDNAYEGIEGSVEELERLLRQRPAPEALRELREQLVEAQRALDTERQQRRATEDRLAEQAEQEMKLLQAVQQLRGQNRLLHIEVSRRGVSVSRDLDRLQFELSRQPPPPSLPPSSAFGGGEGAGRVRPWYAQGLDLSKGPAPSTVLGCSEDDEDGDRFDDSSSSARGPWTHVASPRHDQCVEQEFTRMRGGHETRATGDAQNGGRRGEPTELPLRARLVVNNAAVRSSGQRAGVHGEQSVLSLYKPVTVDVTRPHSVSASVTAPSTTSTRTHADGEGRPPPASPSLPPSPVSGVSHRVAPVLDLQRRSES